MPGISRPQFLSLGAGAFLNAAFSQTGAGNIVPFYMLPTLGGRNTLPGYNDYRFRDHI